MKKKDIKILRKLWNEIPVIDLTSKKSFLKSLRLGKKLQKGKQ